MSKVDVAFLVFCEIRILVNCSTPKSDIAHGMLSVDFVNSRMCNLSLARQHDVCLDFTLEHQGRIGPSKAKGVGKSDFHPLIPGIVWHIIEITLGGGMLVIQRGWQNAVIESQGSKEGFDPASGSQQVASHR